MTKRIVTVFAQGLEEVEAVTPVDLLRRADVEVTVAGLGTTRIEGSHGVVLTTDIVLEDVTGDIDGVVLPGGMPGTANLLASEPLLALVKHTYEAGKLCAAICAAPRVLDAAGVLGSHRFTCYPSVNEQIARGVFIQEPVVRDGNVITGQGVGAAIPFALALVDYLGGAESARRLADEIVYAG